MKNFSDEGAQPPHQITPQTPPPCRPMARSALDLPDSSMTCPPPRSYISRYGPDRSRQIRSQSVHGLGSSDSPKIAISHWVAASPLQQSCTYCRATLWSMSIANHFQQMLNCWLRYLLLLGSLADLYILAIQDVPLVLVILVVPKTLKRFVL